MGRKVSKTRVWYEVAQCVQALDSKRTGPLALTRGRRKEAQEARSRHEKALETRRWWKDRLMRRPVLVSRRVSGY
jgi:hypothetical protein